MIKLKKNHIYKIYVTESSRYDPRHYIFLCPSSDKFIDNRCLGQDKYGLISIDYVFLINLRGFARWYLKGLFPPHFIKIERVSSASDITEIKKALKERDWPYKYIVDKSRIEII